MACGVLLHRADTGLTHTHTHTRGDTVNMSNLLVITHAAAPKGGPLVVGQTTRQTGGQTDRKADAGTDRCYRQRGVGKKNGIKTQRKRDGQIYDAFAYMK